MDPPKLLPSSSTKKFRDDIGTRLFWPSIRMAIRIQHCPLLFHPKPGLFGPGFWHGFVTGKSMICLVRIFIKFKTFTKNQNIWLAAIGVGKNSNWLELFFPMHPFRNLWNILYKALTSLEFKMQKSCCKRSLGGLSSVLDFPLSFSPVLSIQIYIAWHFLRIERLR